MSDGFRYLVEEVFRISGIGTVVSGVIEAGDPGAGGLLRIERPDGAGPASRYATQLLCRRPMPDESRLLSLVLKDFSPDDVHVGDVLRGAPPAGR